MYRTPRRGVRPVDFLWALAAIPLFSPEQSHAQDRGSVFTGVSAGEDRAAYAGLTLAAPGSLGHGPAIRAIVSGGDYGYQSGGARIDADYTSVDLTLLYQWSGVWGYANAGVGAHYTDTELSPDDPGNRRQGDHWDAALAVDGGFNAGPWRTVGYASYAFDMDDYYARLELTRQAGSVVRLGAEAVALGDPSYDRQMYGVVVSFTPASAWEVRLSGGVSDSDTRRGGYGALAFSRSFR